jgi:hypothetical protein
MYLSSSSISRSAGRINVFGIIYLLLETSYSERPSQSLRSAPAAAVFGEVAGPDMIKFLLQGLDSSSISIAVSNSYVDALAGSSCSCPLVV